MGIRELREKYGAKLKGRTAVNFAIRAELPGGAELLDAITAIDAALRIEPNDPNYRRALRELQTKRQALSVIIAQRYDLASARDEGE